MDCCPICLSNAIHGPFTVGPWQATNNANRFGLATVDKSGNQCCSFNEGQYKTFKEASEAAQELDPEEVYADHFDGSMYDPCDDYGPPDSDPYDRDGPYY
jgi:hypothetical protein